MLVLCDYCVIALGLSHDYDDIGTIFKLLFLQTKSPNIETFLYQISQLSQCRVSIPSQYRSLLLSHYVPTFFCYMTGILHWIIERVSLMFVTMPKCIIFNLRGCCIYRGCYNSIPAADLVDAVKVEWRSSLVYACGRRALFCGYVTCDLVNMCCVWLISLFNNRCEIIVFLNLENIIGLQFYGWLFSIIILPNKRWTLSCIFVSDIPYRYIIRESLFQEGINHR